MSEARSNVAPVPRPELKPFQQAQGERLTAVLRRDDGKGEEILLVFGAQALVVHCDEDSDAVRIVFRPISDVSDADDLTEDAAWNQFIGKHFFCGWLTLNQQGYVDGALFSFDGVVPEVGLNVMASAFEVLEIRQRAS